MARLLALCCCHAHGERLDAAQDEIGGVRIDDAAEHALRLAQRRGQVIGSDDGPGHDVIVAGQILGDAVDDEVDAVFQRAEVDRRGEGGVDDGLDVVSSGDVDEARQVQAVHEGIGGRLGKDEARVGPDGRLERVVVAVGYDRAFHAVALEKLPAEEQRAVVALVGEDHVVAGGEQQQ